MVRVERKEETKVNLQYETAVIELEVGYDTKFAEEDKISTALIVLGPEHGETMYNSIQRMEDKGEEVTFADLMEAVKAKWHATGQGFDHIPDAPMETALVAGAKSTNVNNVLTCYYCGEKGHMRRNCPIMKQAKGAMKSAKCKLCDRMGYTTEICSNDPKNAKFCPANFKSRNQPEPEVT